MSFPPLRPIPLSEEVPLVVYSDPYLLHGVGYEVGRSYRLNAVGYEVGRSYRLYVDEDDLGMVINDEKG